MSGITDTNIIWSENLPLLPQETHICLFNFFLALRKNKVTKYILICKPIRSQRT